MRSILRLPSTALRDGGPPVPWPRLVGDAAEEAHDGLLSELLFSSASEFGEGVEHHETDAALPHEPEDVGLHSGESRDVPSRAKV